MLDLSYIFTDPLSHKLIRAGLPKLFQIAEIECSRNGKLGMEIGTKREQILIAFLIYVLGDKLVNVNTPANEAEVDCYINGQPISIKTITGSISGVKLIWTADQKQVVEFCRKYIPTMPILLANIKWNKKGYLYHFPTIVQKEVFNVMGTEYLRPPKDGSNSRGVEISAKAMQALVKNPNTQKIDVVWDRKNVSVDIYKKLISEWETIRREINN